MRIMNSTTPIAMKPNKKLYPKTSNHIEVAESLISLSTSPFRKKPDDYSPTGVEDSLAFFMQNNSQTFSSLFGNKVVLKEEQTVANERSHSISSLDDFYLVDQLNKLNRMRLSSISSETGTISTTTVSTSETKNTPKFIGSYAVPEARRDRIERFLEKRKKRVWSKKIDYGVRKNFADSRLRVKGRFVKKEDESLLKQLMSFT